MDEVNRFLGLRAEGETALNPLFRELVTLHYVYTAELVQGAASVVCGLWRDAPLHAGTIHNSHRSDLVKLLQTL
jgi:hypothetical protein